MEPIILRNDEFITTHTVLRPWLHIGTLECCSGAIAYSSVIHIWRKDKPEQSCAFNRHHNDLIFEYVDADHLNYSQLDNISSFVLSLWPMQQGPLLIHCAGGHTRSPTLALVALASIEKRHPLTLLCGIYADQWRQRRDIPNILERPLKDITRWYEQNRQLHP